MPRPRTARAPAQFSRRRFVSGLARSSAGLWICPLALVPSAQGRGSPVAHSRFDELVRTAPVGRFWLSTETPGLPCSSCHEPEEVEGDSTYQHQSLYVRCELCAKRCQLKPGERGSCRARLNDGGQLKSLVYGRPVAVHVDPIEKKPFYHFLPSASALSLSTTGCPLRCEFCQNWELSQASPEDFKVEYNPPEGIVRTALRAKAPVVAFTYNEPTVFAEYLIDIARVAGREGLASVLVSCGFMTEKPLREMCAVLQAIKIDLKGFSPEFYRTVCSAEIEPVLKTIRAIAASGVHLEIVNLVVPTLNDSTRMLRSLVRWILDEVGPDVPVHFTRFHPDYRLLNLPPTPVSTLERAYGIAREEGLHYPFVGNVPGHPGNNTYCPSCDRAVITRQGFFVTKTDLDNGRCPGCGNPVKGVWKWPQ